MKDIANDTIVLDKLSIRLKKLQSQALTALQGLISELDKSSQYLEGEQFNVAKESVASATATTDTICKDIEKAYEYIENLKKIVVEYSKLKF